MSATSPHSRRYYSTRAVVRFIAACVAVLVFLALIRWLIVAYWVVLG